jgi:hypothetical protein
MVSVFFAFLVNVVGRTSVRYGRGMDYARFTLALPDDPGLIGRLTTALAAQSDPPISIARTGEAVLAFESVTGEMMLRSRVVQALEVAAGPDWQGLARPMG